MMSRLFIKCPKCGKRHWKYAIRCYYCKTSFTTLMSLVLGILLIFGSCLSPKQRAIKKINRLIKKHDLKSDTVIKESVDTFYLTDTLTIPEIQWDTLVEWSLDTLIVIEQDGVKTEFQIFTDTLWLQNTVLERDTMYQKEVVTKTVTQEVKVPEKVIEKEKYIPWWVWFIVAIAVTLGFYVLSVKLLKFQYR